MTNGVESGGGADMVAAVGGDVDDEHVLDYGELMMDGRRRVDGEKERI